jgi:hydrogenase small subunit
MFITRRQFLKYCAASAAALGLSQTDLLKLEKAMAADSCDPGTIPGGLGPCPRVIWIAGANCTGCATGLLNFVAPQAGYNPVGYGLTPQTWDENVPSLAAAYPLAGALDFDGDGVIDIGDVAVNVVSIDYYYVVAAAAGDTLNEHMVSLVLDGQPRTPYILMIEGSVQLGGGGNYCRIFEVPPGRTLTIRGANAGGAGAKCMAYSNAAPVASGCKTTDGVKTLAEGSEVTLMDGAAWLASQPNCAAVIAFGTCATWGGIPAAHGNKTNAQSAWFWLEKKNKLGKPIVNVPGCPPHPDWVVAPILEVILNGIGGLAAKLDTDLCTTKILDPGAKALATEGRPKLTYTPVFAKNRTFCDPALGKCPRFGTEVPEHITQCGRDEAVPSGKCLRGVGCNGWKTAPIGAKADCPTRMFNTHTNWCVGNNYPCQGCTDPNFPDGCAPFFLGSKGKWAGIA